jgi:hypothetical protein
MIHGETRFFKNSLPVSSPEPINWVWDAILSSSEAGKRSSSQRIPPVKAITMPASHPAIRLRVTRRTHKASRMIIKPKVRARARSRAVKGYISPRRTNWAESNSRK